MLNDLSLMLQIATLFALVQGALLARRSFFRAHIYTQATVAVLNLMAVLLFVLTSHAGFTATAIAYTISGLVAEAAGLSILFGSRSRRPRNYRLWMNGAFALWFVVAILGLAAVSA